MHRRLLSLITLLLIVSALPVAASQFIDKPFDDVAREWQRNLRRAGITK